MEITEERMRKKVQTRTALEIIGDATEGALKILIKKNDGKKKSVEEIVFS